MFKVGDKVIGIAPLTFEGEPHSWTTVTETVKMGDPLTVSGVGGSRHIAVGLGCWVDAECFALSGASSTRSYKKGKAVCQR